MISEAGREGGVEGAGGASEPAGMFWGPDRGSCKSVRTEYLRVWGKLCSSAVKTVLSSSPELSRSAESLSDKTGNAIGKSTVRGRALAHLPSDRQAVPNVVPESSKERPIHFVRVLRIGRRTDEIRQALPC
eukprot:3935314-Rhodomonas_salina.1